MLVMSLSTSASAQLFTEDFNYTNGDSLTLHGWLISSGSTTNAIRDTIPGLTYTGYASSGIGNAVSIFTTGQDVYKTFPKDSGNTVYSAFMINVRTAQATGDYFYALSPAESQTNYYGRLFIKSSGAGFLFGISKSNETAVYGTTVFSFNTTYLAVIKYKFDAAKDSNDIITVYALPPATALTSEPLTAEIVDTAISRADAKNLGYITLRQGTATSAPALVMDGIRIDTTWIGAILGTKTYSVGTANVPGEQGHFASLKAAFDSLSNGFAFTGNCTFYITSDITEAEVGGLGIGIACNPAPYTVTFKPFTGVTPTITLQYPSDGNSGPSGACFIGLNGPTMAWADIKTTKNIIFDGSNTAGGTTRDLTIQSTGATRNAITMVITGDASDITIKNCNVFYKIATVSTSGSLLVSALLVRSATAANTGTVEKIPSNITIDNNYLSSNFAGVAQSVQGFGGYASAAPVVYPSNIVIRKNKIEGVKRGVAIYLLGSTDVYGNEIILNQFVADGILNEAVYGLSTLASATYNIYNNKITKVASISSSSATTTGVAGISIEGDGTFNIYNNMISGFALTSANANKSAYVYGIKNSSATATANIYFNTIKMDTLASIGTGTVNYRGIFISAGTNIVKNNVVVNNEDDFASYDIYRPNSGAAGTFAGTLAANYNDYYRAGTTKAKIAFYDTAGVADLAAWKTASAQDTNSVSGPATFVSASDLHMSPSAFSVVSNAGKPVGSVATDIDGDARDAVHPDMGADEYVGVSSGAGFAATPSSLDFKGVLVNQSKKDSIVVKNIGTDTLFITNVTTSDTTFTVTPKTATLASQATQKFYVTFLPKSAGAKSSTLVFINNDAAGKDTVIAGGSGVLGVTIAEARKDANNDLIPDHSITHDTLVVYGVITTPNMQGTQTSYFMQDATGGINIFSFTFSPTTYLIGDSVMVVGTVAQFRGLTELTPLAMDADHFAILKHNAVVPKAKRMTLHQFVLNAEANEGQLVELDTLYKASGTWPLANANASIFVSNASHADTTQMFIDLDTDIDGTTEPVYPINVVGIVSQFSSGTTVYDNGYEIVPRDTSDIKHQNVAGVQDLAAGIPTVYELQNNYPNPFNPSTTIQYGLPKQSHVTVMIYSVLGQEVATLVNDVQAPSYYRVVWNGQDKNGGQVSSGVYFFRLVAQSTDAKAQSFVEVKKMLLMK